MPDTPTEPRLLHLNFDISSPAIIVIMFASPLYILTTAIATVAAAAANFEGLPYQVSDLSITRVAGANVTFNFTVHDPDPVGEATQVCTSTWVVGSRGFPTEGYEPCDGSPFACT